MFSPRAQQFKASGRKNLTLRHTKLELLGRHEAKSTFYEGTRPAAKNKENDLCSLGPRLLSGAHETICEA